MITSAWATFNATRPKPPEPKRPKILRENEFYRKILCPCGNWWVDKKDRRPIPATCAKCGKKASTAKSGGDDQS